MRCSGEYTFSASSRLANPQLTYYQIFQNFDIRPDNVNYELSIKATLTIKPQGFFMRATMRKDRDLAQSLGMPSTGKGAKSDTAEGKSATTTASNANGPKLTVLFGAYHAPI